MVIEDQITHLTNELMNIIYAEDEVDIAELVMELLSMEGHTVFHCSNGAIALNYLMKENEFELLITDHMMPELTGVDLIIKLRQADINIPCLINSATPNLKERLLGAGILTNTVRLLPKPMDISKLTEMVKEIQDEYNK